MIVMFSMLQSEVTDSTQLAQLASNFTVLSPQATEYSVAFASLPPDVSLIYNPCQSVLSLYMAE